MNPGFIMSDDRIQFDKRLDDALVELLVSDKDYRKFLAADSITNKWPSQGDRIRLALVDLTGNRICTPGFAGWGSTWPTSGASTAKIGIVYTAYQLLFDLREQVRVNRLRKTKDLIQKAKESWTGLTCTPDLAWLFTFDESAGPLGVELGPQLRDHLEKMINHNFSNVSTPRASELILRLGFEYIASVMWQSGLRHPTRQGLWFGNTFRSGPTSAKVDARCHIPGSPIIWAKNPLPAKGIFLTALSVATFFTLLAQQRLVNEGLSRSIEALLFNGCSWLRADLPEATIRAAKCGVASPFRHDAGLVQNDNRRYVIVYLTENLQMSDDLRTRFVQDLDQLIKKNNP
jgi:hypothetical protein